MCNFHSKPNFIHATKTLPPENHIIEFIFNDYAFYALWENGFSQKHQTEIHHRF